MEKPIFEVYFIDKPDHFKIYASGKIEGFGPGACINNGVPNFVWTMLAKLRKQLKAK